MDFLDLTMRKGLRLFLTGMLLLGHSGYVPSELGAAYKPSERVLIEEITASNASNVSFTKGIDSTYKIYIIEYWKVRAASDWQYLQMTAATSCDTTCSWFGGTNYDFNNDAIYDWGGGPWEDKSNGAAFISLGHSGVLSGNESGEYKSGWIRFYEPSSTSYYKLFRYSGCYETDSAWFFGYDGGGRLKSSSAVNGIRIQFNSSNIYGTFRLYGIR